MVIYIYYNVNDNSINHLQSILKIAIQTNNLQL